MLCTLVKKLGRRIRNPHGADVVCDERTNTGLPQKTKANLSKTKNEGKILYF
jgi:hypothetical protein